MNLYEKFACYVNSVKDTAEWRQMANTHEQSPWHREESVAVHTEMCIEAYLDNIADQRTPHQQLLVLIELLYHDFGKPPAEETLEKKDQPGVFYHRYAGHEPISANMFIDLMVSRPELREPLFQMGLTWNDLRKIKVMIEHHLPYGLKNVQKRNDLKWTMEQTLGEDEVCFYDGLWSDSRGRISDDHATKMANVEAWIAEFKAIQVKKPVKSLTCRGLPVYDIKYPTLHVLVGCSGAGKSTYTDELLKLYPEALIFSEDALRYEYFYATSGEEEFDAWKDLSKQEQYTYFWEFCHLRKESKYEQFAAQRWEQVLQQGFVAGTGGHVVLDRMNQGKKGRGKYINRAKQLGYDVVSHEFYVPLQELIDRQKTRGDKELPEFRVKQIYNSVETPWLGPEVDRFELIVQQK